jgi:translation initiation factor 2B subunit (eIF-2B alpha/beta/delta family)
MESFPFVWLRGAGVQAKDALCRKIDDYVRDRIIFADQVIQGIAGKKIKDGDVVLTYARCGDSIHAPHDG